ncbi:cellulose-binding domain-containing protein [Sphaerisporangium sp. TRM90804]|uniref:cellulose-binding domain-containing protein n=1 Tax=Sphaerisporangium sp. TRM90804 TaxID=3031113 RepID=UPI002449B89A|nr:cellulose-binding domain-containing protein [Sphaerisporangium sp. TRM90804]MDH2426527.1 cellulose-binding domain-containing protein [Sphaerisporangium sp. TRM90804]
MKGRWAVSWAVAALAGAVFLVPAVGSASGEVTSGVAGMDTLPPRTPGPTPSLLWPCHDPRTPPPSRPPLTPPTAPGTPQAGTVANNMVHLRWGASTDADGLACYQVYEERNGVRIKVATFGPGVTEGYLYVDYPPYGTATRVARLYVVAVDRWGADSPPSETVEVTVYNDVVTPSPTPTRGACQVTYDSHWWPGGMTASVSIKNTGATAIAGWRLTFTYPDPGQRLTSGWSANWTQTGSVVTATPLSWNQNIAPGATVAIGFRGTHEGANPTPSVFQLNGATCG